MSCQSTPCSGIAYEISQHPHADLIYSDEDKIDVNGRRHDPHFKPDWNPALILIAEFPLPFGSISKRRLLEKIGRFRVGFEGSQDHDLVLRYLEATSPSSDTTYSPNTLSLAFAARINCLVQWHRSKTLCVASWCLVDRGTSSEAKY